MDRTFDVVWGVLITQAVLGGIGLIGLVAILRRFLVTEFPATMASINGRLEALHKDFEDLSKDLREMGRKVERNDVLLDDARNRIRDIEQRRRTTS